MPIDTCDGVEVSGLSFLSRVMGVQCRIVFLVDMSVGKLIDLQHKRSIQQSRRIYGVLP